MRVTYGYSASCFHLYGLFFPSLYFCRAAVPGALGLNSAGACRKYSIPSFFPYKANPP